MSPRTLLLVSLCLGIAATAAAATIHVPGEQPSIAAGLAAASAGDTVLVACGTYNEWDLSMPSEVTLRGQTGIGGCVTVDAGGNSRAILLDGTLAGTRIEGLDITGGSFSAGPALYFWHAVATIRDCRIHDNVGGGFGGAVYARYADTHATFEGCWFENNVADMDGGAIYDLGAGSLTINGCTFIGNEAGRDGGAVYSYGGDIDLIACTFEGNGCAQYGSAAAAADAAFTLERCLATGGTFGGALFEYSGGSLALTCCDLYGNTGGDWTSDILDQLGVNGNISEDPLYCGEPDSGNYLLQSDSPCAPINAGCGMHIGAWDVGCEGTTTEASSWSRVKSLY